MQIPKFLWLLDKYQSNTSFSLFLKERAYFLSSPQKKHIRQAVRTGMAVESWPSLLAILIFVSTEPSASKISNSCKYQSFLGCWTNTKATRAISSYLHASTANETTSARIVVSKWLHLWLHTEAGWLYNQLNSNCSNSSIVTLPLFHNSITLPLFRNSIGLTMSKMMAVSNRIQPLYSIGEAVVALDWVAELLYYYAPIAWNYRWAHKRTGKNADSNEQFAEEDWQLGRVKQRNLEILKKLGMHSADSFALASSFRRNMYKSILLDKDDTNPNKHRLLQSAQKNARLGWYYPPLQLFRCWYKSDIACKLFWKCQFFFVSPRHILILLIIICTQR